MLCRISSLDPFLESAVAGLVGRIAFGEVSPLGASAHPANPSLDPEDATKYLPGGLVWGVLYRQIVVMLGISGARMFHCLSLRSIRLFYAPVITLWCF